MSEEIEWEELRFSRDNREKAGTHSLTKCNTGQQLKSRGNKKHKIADKYE